uniref:histidine kinase n=1 Tax=uncultured bacterium esnapd1.2 TaxID=1366589 RepID=S5TTN2_9BACT|nr:hypothetical protein [uncultured bacterium esnapd1.2]
MRGRCTERARRYAADAVVLAALLAVVGTESAALTHRTWWELPAGVLVCVLAVVTGQGWPAVSLVVGGTASLVYLPDLAGRFPAWPVVVMAVIGYRAGRRDTGAAVGLTGVAAVAGVGLVIGGLWSWLTMALTLLALVVPYLAGRYHAQDAAIAELGWRRAAELEQQQLLVAEQARLRERARIAADMHDSLGHELSLVALRAAVLQIAPDVPAHHQDAAGELRAGAAAATERLREIIGVLRGGDPVPPASRDEPIAELVARTVASGVTVSLDADPVLPPVPVAVDRAAYRVVQEALTNAVRHAPGAAVHVDFARTADTLTVRVVNGAARRAPDHGASGGTGLAGLRERVRRLGGDLRAAPTGRGFEVVARLPCTQTPDGLPGGAGGLPAARRRVRRRLVAALVLPAVLGLALAVTAQAHQVHAALTSVLTPGDAAAMRIGQSRHELSLPARQHPDPPDAPPPPDHVRCEYYAATHDPFAAHGPVHRLCFQDGRLVSKEILR